MNALSLMRRFTIRLRMLGAIAMVLVLLAIVGGAGTLGIARMDAMARDFAATTFADARELSALRQELGNVRRFEKDLLLNYENPAEIDAYLPKWQKAVAAAAKHAKALGHEGESATAVAEIVASLAAYEQKAAPVVRQVRAQAYDTATGANRAMKGAKDEIRRVEDLSNRMAELLDNAATANAQARDAARTQTWLLFGSALALAVLLVVPLTLLNSHSIVAPMARARDVAEQIAAGDLTQRLEDQGADEAGELMRALSRMQQSLQATVGQVLASTDSVRHASAEIASGNADLSSRTEEAAGSLQQTAASMHQLTGTVQQSADAARQANQLAASAAEVAQRGGTVVSQVVTTMNEIQASSKKIADIIGTIDGIAFQTNILALNAAVEAARAGEQGRGFAVVASEVRSLAHRSADAARQIKGLIDASVARVDGGSRLVADAGKTMQEIVGSVQRVTDIIGEITASATEQSSGIGQVNAAVGELDRMTQQNAALVEQSAAAAESLKDQAGKLAQAVSGFRLHAA